MMACRDILLLPGVVEFVLTGDKIDFGTFKCSERLHMVLRALQGTQLDVPLRLHLLCLEGHGDSASSLTIRITRVIIWIIVVINLLTKAP